MQNVEKRLSKELLPVAWHHTGCWERCMSKDEKRGIEKIFTDNVGKWW